MSSIEDENTRIRALRDRLEQSILATIPDTSRNGGRDNRLPNTSNIAFNGCEAEAILLLLDREGICVSSGSACTTGSLTTSHVLTAMGLSSARAKASIRFSLGIYNTAEEVDHLLARLPGVIATARGTVTPSITRSSSGAPALVSA